MTSLLRFWLLSLHRSWFTNITSVAMLFGVGMFIPLLINIDIPSQIESFVESVSQEEEEAEEAELSPLEVDGRLPKWVEWPTDLKGEPIALEVTYDEGQADIEILAGQDQARAKDVHLELKAQARHEASRRLDRLGIPDREEDLVDFVVESESWSLPFGSGAALTIVLAFLGWISSTSILMNTLPVDRASGALETLRATRLSARQIAWLWWLLAVIELVLNITISLVGLAVGSVLFGLPPMAPALLALPLFWAPAIALGVRLISRAQDLRGGAFMTLPLLFILVTLFSTSFVFSSSPLVAAMVPIGGALLFALGDLPWPTVFVVA